MSHKRLKVFILIALFLPFQQGWSQKELIVNYFRPYIYDAGNNTVRAWINDPYTGGEISVLLGGKEVKTFRGEPGKTELVLPIVGETSEMDIFSGSGQNRTLISRQLFRPLIPSEWGIFGRGSVNIICSSHQDIAWMNTPDSCREERIHDIILPALDIIDRDSDYRFEMEQTLNLMEVLEALPGEKQRIASAGTSGKFTWGATFNQPYEGLESGEQLVRQAYLGRRWIRENIPGMDALAAYNVDVPGRSLQVPQIFSKAGIKYLFVSRMKEGFYNWYSPDGSRILTYSPGNYGWALLVYRYFEDDAITAMQKLNKVLVNQEEYYSEHNLPPHYGVVISTDAGGPRNYRDIIREWNKIAMGSGFDIPVLQHSTTEEFLSKIDVPGIRPDSIYGERPDLWLYIHGPAHYEAIRAKKAAAVSLPAAEIFSTIASMVKGTFQGYPSNDLFTGWYKSIYPDHGWGGKNGEITDSIFRASLEEGNQAGQRVLSHALDELASEVRLENPGAIIVYNDLSWPRNGIVSVDISSKKGAEWIVTETSGKSVHSVVRNENGTGKTIRFVAENVPSLGYRTYYLRKGREQVTTGIKAGANFYENEFYSVQLGDGGIVSLYDKDLEREVFNTTKYSGGDLLSLGYNGNGAGEFVIITPVNYDGFETLGSHNYAWSLAENNSVSAVFESVGKLRNFTVRQVITIYHHMKRIDFDYDIPDWSGEKNRQLRVAFPLNMDSAEITYDVPMGILHAGKDELRDPPLGWSWEGTYRQPPGEIHPREIENFLSSSDMRSGVTLSTDLAVADWIDPGRESAGYPVLQAILLSSHKSCHYLGNWYLQTGSHHFRFSLTSHAPGWKNGYHFGVEGNHPLPAVFRERSQRGTLPEELSFITPSSPFVRITAFKKSESGNSAVLRMAGMSGADENFELKFYYPVRSLYRTSLIEDNATDTGQKGKILKFSQGKNAIETYRIEF